MFIYLRPVLMVAASIVLVMLLVSTPIKRFLSSGNDNIAEQKLTTDTLNSTGTVPASIFSYFSEEQFMAAFSDMKELDADTISTDKLGAFIAANYSDYDIISYN